MKQVAEWVVGAIGWAVALGDIGSANPVIAAQKRAEFGMFLSLLCAAVLLGLAYLIAPDANTSNDFLPVAAFRGYAMAGFAVAALLATAVGICFIVRYALVVKWPERFVDISE